MSAPNASDFAGIAYLAGRVLQRNYDNDVNLDLTNGASVHFDHLGRPTQYVHDDGTGTVVGFEYAYDQAGNKAMQKSVHDATDSQRYAYDSANRLTAFRRGSFRSTAFSCEKLQKARNSARRRFIPAPPPLV